MAEAARGEPYVGPRPFTRDDAVHFYGREGEVRELVSLVVANKLVLLYAASGAGKTSLLNAGLIPALERDENFHVLPRARIGGGGSNLGQPSGVSNVYTRGLLLSWGERSEQSQADSTLADYLRTVDQTVGADGFLSPRAVVVDQLEELFTLYPEHWEQRQAFIEEIAEALAQDPLLRVVLAIREDYLAELDAYAEHLPGGLQTRYRLERLGPDAALSAVTEPLEGTGREFAPGVADKLVADLRTFRVDTGRGSSRAVLGEFVEPVQLQVSCRSLWEDLPEDLTEITEKDLRTFGDVDEVLCDFYTAAVREAAQAGHTRESQVRDWIEAALITSVGTRGTVHREAASVPTEAINELVSRHLIRGEWRAGSEWYELTHDRLIEPIRSSNERFRAAVTRRRRRLGALVSGVTAMVLVVAALYVLLTQSKSTVAPSLASIRKALIPSVIKPAQGAHYLRGSKIDALYYCHPAAGIEIKSCTGTVPRGTPIDTSDIGRHTFTVTANDPGAGISVTQSTVYVVVRFVLDAYLGKAFSVQYPSGWRRESAENLHGTYTDTTVVSARDAHTIMRIDVTSNAKGTVAQQADPVIKYVSGETGYRQIELRPSTFDGFPAVRWKFVVLESGVALMKEDVFFQDSKNGDGVAFLTQAPVGQYAALGPEFDVVRQSFQMK